MKQDQLQSLLKARAEVRMPSGYTERLLENLHNRQRAELLQRSLWRIASERLGTFLSEHSLSTPVYALSLAAVFLVCLGAIFLLRPAVNGPAITQQARSPVFSKPPDAFQQPVDAQPVSYGK
jgi:hypothetical protein